MKYNISNLDQFISDKDRTNAMTFGNILNNRLNVIEDKIKGLIRPYANIDTLNTLEIAAELAHNYLELKHIVHIDYEEYCIINTINNTKDYFLTRHNVDLEKIESWITISEIVRGIK